MAAAFRTEPVPSSDFPRVWRARRFSRNGVLHCCCNYLRFPNSTRSVQSCNSPCGRGTSIADLMCCVRFDSIAAAQEPRCCLCYLIFLCLLVPMYLLFVLLNPIAGLLCGMFKSVHECYSIGAARAARATRLQFNQEQAAREDINSRNRQLLHEDVERGVTVVLTSTLAWQPDCSWGELQRGLCSSPLARFAEQPQLMAQIASHCDAEQLCLLDSTCTFFARGIGSEQGSCIALSPACSADCALGSSGDSITEIAARFAFARLLESWSESSSAVQCESGETWKRLLGCTDFGSEDVPAHLGSNLASFQNARPRAVRALRFMHHESHRDSGYHEPLLESRTHTIDRRLADSGWFVQQCPRTCDFLGFSGFWGGLMAAKYLAKWRFETGAEVVRLLHDWN